MILVLTSPFWEDPSEAAISGEDEDAVTQICVQALLAAGYDVKVREDGGDDVPWGEQEDA